MIVDIFPNIDIPVVYVAWSYNGLNAEDMERRVVLVAERAYSTTVNGIERIESLSIPGQGILKIYFQPGANIGGAIAQISAQSNAVLRIAPPGMQPPNIIQFNASNVPVVQVTLNSRTLPEQMLSDYANQFLRLRLFTIPGLSIPGAFGGKQRQIIVEVDTAKASAKGLSQMDVVNAMGTTNVIVPAGIARLGTERIQHPAQFQPAAWSSSSIICRSASATEFRCCSATSPRSATASRSRPISSASTVSAPASCRSSRTAPPRRWRWWTPSRTCCRSCRRSRRRAWNWGWTSTSRCSCARRSRTSSRRRSSPRSSSR